MTEIERKALELVNEVSDGFHDVTSVYDIHTAKALRSALCRAIERHEAFRQEVSDAVAEIAKAWGTADPAWGYLRRFIIAKPDPLVEALTEAFSESGAWEPCDLDDAKRLRAALAKRGLEIREVSK